MLFATHFCISFGNKNGRKNAFWQRKIKVGKSSQQKNNVMAPVSNFSQQSLILKSILNYPKEEGA